MRKLSLAPFSVGLLAAACMPALVVSAPPAHAQDTVLGVLSLDSPSSGLAKITGGNFGNSGSDISVTFGSVAARLRYWSPSAIVVFIPASLPSTPVDIVLNVGKVREEDLGSYVIRGGGPANIEAKSPIAAVPIAASDPPIQIKATTSVPATRPVQSSPVDPQSAQDDPAPKAAPAASGPAAQAVAKAAAPVPAISDVNPTKGVATTPVTITGSGFGDSQGKSMVTFGGLSATVAKDGWSDTKLVVTAPDFNASQNLPLAVSLSLVDATSGTTTQVDASTNFTENPAPWSDNDEKPFSIKIVGGYEQGFQSAQISDSDAFVAVYGRSLFRDDTFGPFYHIRLQTAPQASNTYGVVSVLNSPTSAVTTQSLQGVGSAVDLDLGLEYQIKHLFFDRQTSISLIAGGGFVTPLQANSINATYTMPAFGTVECTELQSRFKQAGVLNSSIYAGITPNAAAGSASCFTNNIGVASGGSGTNITTLEYAVPDQSNFFPKYFAGLRTLSRFPGSSGSKSCNASTPCERGYVDFTLGQNASISGGSLKHLVFNADSIYPMPIQSLNFLYIFGSASKRLHNLPANQSPLVLQVPSPIPTSGPNPAILVVPMTQPDRDFYRIGIGISLNQIFSALKPSSNPAP